MDNSSDQSISNIIQKKVMVSKDRSFSHLAGGSLNVILFKYEEEWKKTPFEGSLCVYRRKTIPSMALIILNRKAPLDFTLEIDATVIEMEAEDRFIILKKVLDRAQKEIEIFGLWFSDRQDSIKISFILQDQLALIKKSAVLLGLAKNMCINHSRTSAKKGKPKSEEKTKGEASQKEAAQKHQENTTKGRV